MVLTTKEKLEIAKKKLGRLKAEKEIEEIGMKRKEELKKARRDIRNLKYGKLIRSAKGVGRGLAKGGVVVGRTVKRVGENIEKAQRRERAVKKKAKKGVKQESFEGFLRRI